MSAPALVRPTRPSRSTAVVGRAARLPLAGGLLAPAPSATLTTDVLVIGTGIAGLSVAHGLAGCGLQVDLVTKTGVGDGSTPWAQGGIATGGAPDDDPALHVADTLTAGAGLADPEAVAALVAQAGAAVEVLLRAGARFDRDSDGALAWTREGGHSRSRIIHAGGDATGAEVQRTLTAAVLGGDGRPRQDGVRLHEWTFLLDLLTNPHDGSGAAVTGALLARVDPAGRCLEVISVSARAVVLAAGGHGQLYATTTNPQVATGDGLAAAVRAGAAVADLEFVQFHPTALAARRATPGGPARQQPLVTEALRGEGAVLLDVHGVAFMAGEHPLADLAPRDVVSAAIGARLRATGADHVLLDARHLGADLLTRRFPTVLAACRAAGIDPVTQPIPVAPAAHYACGGVVADLSGRTGLPGLYAAGEVACTGVHGANRLASNSLLEALVAGRNLAALLSEDLPARDETRVAPRPGVLAAPARRDELAVTMSRDAGVLRDPVALAGLAEHLAEAVHRPDEDAVEPGLAAWEATNLHTVAALVVNAALLREESRGCHRRSDVPDPDDAWRHHIVGARVVGTRVVGTRQDDDVRLEVRP